VRPLSKARRDVSLGKLQIETARYVGPFARRDDIHIHGLDTPLAIVGDVLFPGLQAASGRLSNGAETDPRITFFRAG